MTTESDVVSESTAIAVFPEKENALAVFSTDKGLDPYLAKIREMVDEFKSAPPKLTTESGRKEYKSMAYKVARMKTALEGMKKDVNDEYKQITKKVDAEGKRVWDTLEAWQDEILEPVIKYEQEQARIKAEKEAAEAAAEAQRLAEIAAKELQDQVDRDHELAVFMFAEHLRQKEEAAKQAIIDAENAAREQKEREEQIAKEAAERARIAAEQAAAAEQQRIKDEATRQAAEAQAAVERAQREKAESEAAALRQQQESESAAAKAKQDAEDAAIAAQRKAEADKQAAIEAERKRQADALEAERLATEQREKNKAHAKRINNEALQDLMSAGLSEDCAKQAITAIAKGVVRNVKINY